MYALFYSKGTGDKLFSAKIDNKFEFILFLKSSGFIYNERLDEYHNDSRFVVIYE